MYKCVQSHARHAAIYFNHINTDVCLLHHSIPFSLVVMSQHVLLHYSRRIRTTNPTATTTTHRPVTPLAGRLWAPLISETFGQWIGDVQDKYPTKYDHVRPQFVVPIGVKREYPPQSEYTVQISRKMIFFIRICNAQTTQHKVVYGFFSLQKIQSCPRCYAVRELGNLLE